MIKSGNEILLNTIANINNLEFEYYCDAFVSANHDIMDKKNVEILLNIIKNRHEEVIKNYRYNPLALFVLADVYSLTLRNVLEQIKNFKS